MLQPQKRQDMRKALEACMGRMLEIRHWMVRLSVYLSCARSGIQHSFGQQHQQEQAELSEVIGAVLQSQGDLLILQQCWYGCQSSVSKLSSI